MRENLLKKLKQTIIAESEVTSHGHGCRLLYSMKLPIGMRPEDFMATPPLEV